MIWKFGLGYLQDVSASGRLLCLLCWFVSASEAFGRLDIPRYCFLHAYILQISSGNSSLVPDPLCFPYRLLPWLGRSDSLFQSLFQDYNHLSNV